MSTSASRKSASPQASHGMFSRLHLTVTCHTDFGQTVRVSGSSLLAGVYDPTVALEMVTTPEEYPRWRTKKPIIVPRNFPHKYMYALFEGGKFLKWEGLSRPRKLVCDAPYVRQDDAFGGQPGSPGRSRLSSEAGISTKNSSAASLAQRAPPPDAKLYLVCFHLPVSVYKDEEGEWKAIWNESLIAKTDHSVAERINTYWVGTVANPEEKEFTKEDQEVIVKLLKPMKCTPIFVGEKVIRGSYLGYCKQILWPAFHNVDVLDLASKRWNPTDSGSDPTLTWDQANTAQWWDSFRSLNKAFADLMWDVLSDNESSPKVMWVHDYHLMLLPKMLSDWEQERLGRRKTSIVFFLHIPFPTSQIFRALAHGDELLQGMLSANIVGFHAFDHARHFLNAGKRLLGLSYQSIKGGLIGVEYQRRTVMVVMSHVGTEPDMLDRSMNTEDTKAHTEQLKAKHPGK
ncbi:unnamed protein product [Discosporangium mesarthrocarpum]